MRFNIALPDADPPDILVNQPMKTAQLSGHFISLECWTG